MGLALNGFFFLVKKKWVNLKIFYDKTDRRQFSAGTCTSDDEFW